MLQITHSGKMDPKIWSNLPDEVLEHILSLLPLKTLLSLRSTCKHIYSLIFSPSFISKHTSSSSSSSPPFSSFLLLSHPQFHNQYYTLYDSIRRTWRNLEISLSLHLPYSSTLLSTSNGLFCFSLPNSPSLLVCNFLSKSSRQIKFPTFPLIAYELLTLVYTPTGFKIFMISSKSSSNTAFVYDSSVDSWREFNNTLNHILRDNHHNQEGVFFNGYLYFTTAGPFSIVFFDLETGNWERLVAELPEELTFIRLVTDNGGKLYLIGGIGRNGISRSMKLWELEDEDGEGGRMRRKKWVEIERVPETICRKFGSVCYHNYEHVYCFWHEGMICVCCNTWPEILYCKISRKTWHWLPKCPSMPDKWSCGFRWFSFVPQMYALV